MTGFTDRLDLGYFPLQDHDPQVAPSMRQSVGGGRIVKLTDPDDAGDSVDATMSHYGRVNGMGTLGDVHPWMVVQTKDRDERGMAMWAQVFAAMVVGGGTGGFRGNQTGTPVKQAQLQPIRGVDRGKPALASDARMAVTKATWSDGLSSVPQGALMTMIPGTEETRQADLMLWSDPRIVAPSVKGPGEAATLVVDLQPEGEFCMDGSRTPGVGGRHARITTIFRVVPFDEVPVLGGKGNVVALNHTASEQEGLPGYGAVWAKFAAGGGATIRPGPTTPIRPGPTAPIRPGPTARVSSGPEGSPLGATSGDAPGGRRTFGVGGAPESDNSLESMQVHEFGVFKPEPKGGKGTSFMAAVGACGPLHPGGVGCRHQLGVDADGNPVTSGHLSTEAYFYRNNQFDGPLLFEGIWPDDVQSFGLKSFVHLDWDESLSHKSLGQNGNGRWRWWAEVPDMTPRLPPNGEPPTNPTTPRPTGPGTPGPTTPTRPVPGKPTGPGKRPGGRPGVRPGPTGPIRPGPGPGRSWTTPTTPGGTGGAPSPASGPLTGGPGSPSAGPRAPGGSEGGADGPIRPGPNAPQPFNPGDYEPSEDLEQTQYLSESGVITQVGPIGGAGGGGTGPEGGSMVDLEYSADRNPWTQETRVTPGTVETVGEAGPESIGLYTLHRPFATSFGGAISFRPQLWLKGYPNIERNPLLQGRIYEFDEVVRPQVLVAHPFGGVDEADGDWSYTTRPKNSRARGGVANGGLFYHPPEFEMEDYFGINSRLDTDAPTSVGYTGYAPGTRIGFGVPNLDGSMANGSSVVHAPTAGAALEVSQLANGSLTTIVDFDLDGSQPCADFKGTGAVKAPVGTTGERPTGAAGKLRLNSTTGRLEYHDGSNWVGSATESEVAVVSTDAFQKDGSVAMEGGADWGEQDLLHVGLLRGRDVDTDNTNKNFYGQISEYTNANPPVTLWRGRVTSTQSQLWVGGDDSGANRGVTAIKFYIAPSKSSTAHVEEVRFLADAYRFGGSGTPTERLEVYATSGHMKVHDADGTHEVEGGIIRSITNLTLGTTLDGSHYTCLCDATVGGFTVTLPAAAPHSGRVYRIVKSDSSSNVITVDGNGSETINGATTQSLSTQYDTITIQSNGTGWFILAQ